MDNNQHAIERDIDDGEALKEPLSVPKFEADLERVKEETTMEKNFEVAKNTWNMNITSDGLKRENDDEQALLEPVFVPVNVEFERASEEIKKEVSEGTESSEESSDSIDRLLHMECSFQVASSSSGILSCEAVGMSIQEPLPTNSCSEHSTLLLQNLQCQTSFTVASSSTIEDTIGQEDAAWGYLSECQTEDQIAGVSHGQEEGQVAGVRKGQEEEQIAGVRQRQRRCTGSEDTHVKGEMQTSASSRNSSEESKRAYECSMCKMQLPSKYLLNKHMRVHTGEDPYKCSRCEQSFSNRSKFTVHMRKHTSDKPYQCSQCKKSFTRYFTLTRHIRSHTGERPYKCSDCKKCFTCSGSLTKHIRIHTGERPYKCSHCGKSFTEGGSLTIHRRIHTGEKPYKCSECEKSFTESGKLKNHMRMHTGEKPYKCSQCDKSFSVSSNFINHMRTHTSEKPYNCSQCEKSYRRRRDLCKHMLTHKVLFVWGQ